MSSCNLDFQRPGFSFGSPRRSLHAFADDKPHSGELPSEVFRQVLDAIQDGMILTDSASRVLYANRTAREIFNLGSLVVRHQVLCAQVAGETRALHNLVSACARGETANAHFTVSGPCPQGQVVLMATTSDVFSAMSPTVIIIARQLSRVGSPSARVISSVFGLTPAEARLALELMKGDGLKPCALRLGVSPSTARTHLKHVFEKTGTRRQAELVRLLFGCCFDTSEHRSDPVKRMRPNLHQARA